MTFDEDRIRQSLRRNLEGMEVPREVPAATMRRGRARRFTWMAAVASLVVVALVGGIAGGMTLLEGDGAIDPAPNPEETSACVPADYDLAVFIPERNFHTKVAELGDLLKKHNAVASLDFVSSADAFEEYRRENPEWKGNPHTLPTHATRTQYRVTLRPGADSQRLSADIANLAAGTYTPARDCAPADPQEKFARYFFEADEGNTSASGRLEVKWEQRELCLELQARNIQVAHLLFMDPSRPDGRGSVVFTFFDPFREGEAGPTLPASGTHCFREAQLGELDDELLAELVDTPQRFRVDFHRGPNDEPGLVAELMTAEEAFAGSTYVDKEDRVSVHVPPGWHVAEGLLTPELLDPKEILSLGTAPMPVPDDRCAHQPGKALESMSHVDAFVSVQEAAADADHPPRPESFEAAAEDRRDQFQSCASLDGIKTYWIPFSDEGRNFSLLAAVGDESPGRREEMWKVIESLDFSPDGQGQPSPPAQTEDGVYFTIDPEKMDPNCGAYDRSYVERPVVVPEGEDSVLTHALRSLFQNEWDVPRMQVEKVEVVDGKAVVDLASVDGLGFASTSCGSVGFLGSILRTAFQFNSVESVEMRLAGSCRRFGEYMQSLRCDVYTRKDLRRGTSRGTP